MKEVSTYQLYRRITDLPLRNYIDGVVNNNVSAIIKSGVCDDEDVLLSVWQDIHEQYAGAIGSGEQQLTLSLFKEINKLSIAIEQVAILVGMLQKGYVPSFGNQLNKILNTNFQFDITDTEGYAKLLQRCINQSKGFQLQLNLKLSQFKAIQEKDQKPGQKPTHEYFVSVLITLSDHAGYRVEDSISVYEFCDRIKRLNKAMEEANRK